jgi:hypothetical protein
LWLRREPAAQPAKPAGDRKNCYLLPTTIDRSFEPWVTERQVQLRYSKQPETNDAKEGPIVGLRERVYESTKLAALFDVLVDQGCPADEILRNVNLTVEEFTLRSRGFHSRS